MIRLDPNHVQPGHPVIEDLRLFGILHDACSDFEQRSRARELIAAPGHCFFADALSYWQVRSRRLIFVSTDLIAVPRLLAR